MRRSPIILLFMVVWTIVTVSVLLCGFPYNWPDNVHIDYGLPLVWGTNTTGTIAGLANLWSISIANLLVDLIFWLGIMIAAVALLLFTDRISG